MAKAKANQDVAVVRDFTKRDVHIILAALHFYHDMRVNGMLEYQDPTYLDQETNFGEFQPAKSDEIREVMNYINTGD